jgi:hypothetical protein
MKKAESTDRDRLINEVPTNEQQKRRVCACGDGAECLMDDGSYPHGKRHSASDGR